MKSIKIIDILRITNGRLLDLISDEVRGNLLNKEIKDIVIDSREVKEDSLFVAIVGENVDAHKFIPDVAKITDVMLIEKDEEEILALSDKRSLLSDKAYIRVDSTLEALQLIGEYERSLYKNKVVNG